MSPVEISTFDYKPQSLYFYIHLLIKVLNFSLSLGTQIISVDIK